MECNSLSAVLSSATEAIIVTLMVVTAAFMWAHVDRRFMAIGAVQGRLTHYDSGIVQAHLGAGDSCSSSNDLIPCSRPKRISVSRRFPRLSTSHIVGMPKIPY